MDRVNDGYRQLVSSVLNLAISDRKDAIRKLEVNPENEKARELLEDCDTFFASEECALMLEFLDISKERFMEVVYGC